LVFIPTFFMKKNSFSRVMVAGLVASFSLLSGEIFVASADVFTIDPTQSSLTLSGSILGSTFTPQGAGSMTTVYTGTIQVTQTPDTIQFTGQSLITAQTNGSWKPLAGGGNGSAPADYGAAASSAVGTVNAAFRSILLDVTSAPVTVTNGQFDPSGLTFLFPASATSAIDYRSSIASGSKHATGNAANNVADLSTISTAGNVQTLTIGVNVQFTFSLINSGDTIVNVAGQIVATNSPSVVTPVVLQSPTVSNQVVTLQWQSPTGQIYQVLSSSNLATWQTNGLNVTSDSTNYTWTATNSAPKAFYRLAH
jgi:hypothetical protein